MNTPLPSVLAQRSAEAAQARFAQRVANALSEHQLLGSHTDIEVRLRFAHDRALACARQARGSAATAPAVLGLTGGAAVRGGGPDVAPWWLRLGSLLPLVILLAGLMLIDSHYTRSQIEAAVEVDVAILADALPPAAYRDHGFLEFLKTARP